MTVALTPEQSLRLKREQKARRDAGLEAALLNAARRRRRSRRSAAFGSLRTKDGATLDPYRACVGLAAAAALRGAQIFERSPVKKITFTRKDGGRADGRRFDSREEGRRRHRRADARCASRWRATSGFDRRTSR